MFKIWQKALGLLRPFAVFVRRNKLAVGLGLAAVLVLPTYVWLSWGRSIHLSYAGQNCVNDLSILPSLHKSKGDEVYSISTQNNITAGGYPILSRQTCIDINRAPFEGVKHKVGLAFLNIPILQKNFRITSGEHPNLNVKVLDSAISVQDPLVFKLDKPDKLFDYYLLSGDKTAECWVAVASLFCDVEQLGLQQGSQYELLLKKTFESQSVAIVAQQKVQTAVEVKIVSSSISGNTVYDTPMEFNLVSDKPLVAADVALWQIMGNGEKKLLTQTTAITQRQITIRPAEQLPRDTNFELVVASATAADKGALAAPYVLPFKMSGGPKVAAASIGSRSVDPSASITLTFDQKVAAGHDFDKLLSLTDGSQPIDFSYSFSDQKLVIKPKQTRPICSHLHLQLSGVITSVYNISGNYTWKYSSRIKCYTVFTIGYSAQGRAIQAWKFGSGVSKVLYVAATHGNEKGTKYLMDKWIAELEANPDKIPPQRTIYVIPTINPDGFATGSRRSAQNVDLNRNFPTNDWKADVTMPGGELVVNGGGTQPLSAPESQALASFVQAQQPRLVITYHSVASVVSANDAGDSAALAATYASLSKYWNLPPAQTGDVFHYDTTGSFEIWLAEDENIAGLLVELGSHSDHQFSRNKSAMWAMATAP